MNEQLRSRDVVRDSGDPTVNPALVISAVLAPAMANVVMVYLVMDTVNVLLTLLVQHVRGVSQENMEQTA